MSWGAFFGFKKHPKIDTPSVNNSKQQITVKRMVRELSTGIYTF